MAQHRSNANPIRTIPSRQYFVRSEDIGDVFAIILMLSLLIFFGSAIILGTLGLEDRLAGSVDAPPPQGSLFFATGILAVGFLVGNYVLVRHKYKLPWSEIGLTFHNWQGGLLWALALLPIAFLIYWLEEHSWRWVLHRHSIPLLTPWQGLLEFTFQLLKAYGVVGLCEAAAVIIMLIVSQGIFMWGLVYNALKRETSSIWSGMFSAAFAFLMLYLLQLAFLPLVSVCFITFAYQRTRTLLTPLTMAIGVVLLSLIVSAFVR